MEKYGLAVNSRTAQKVKLNICIFFVKSKTC